MGLINKNIYISNRINSLQEKIESNNELTAFSKKLAKEKGNKKYDSYYKNQIDRLYLLSLSFADIDDEINRRLPKQMLKFNVKDYWKRRELIQIMRKETSKGDSEAFARYEKAASDLNKAKSEKEAQIKEKIKTKLSNFIFTDEVKRQERINEYNLVKEELENNLRVARQEIDVNIDKKCVGLDAKNQKRNEKILTKIEKLKAKLDNKDSFVLDDDVLLKVDHLTMQFGGLKAVDDLSFEVKKGEIFGLIGPNGAGKTTVFNCITQFYEPTKGNLYFSDRGGSTILLNNIKVHNVIKKGIVRTFQNVEVIKEVSVLDNLLIAAHSQYRSNLFAQFLHLPILKKEELAIKEKALEVLEFMGLSLYKDMLAWGLPYGVLKKIEIARTLMNNPQLIILDEPAAGLNDTETTELTEIIRKIQEKYKCTILLVEHDMGLVMDICDTVCAISFGKMLAIGTTEEIQANKDVQKAYLGSDDEE